MKKTFRPAILALVGVATFAAVLPSRAQLLVTEVMSNSGGGGTNDWFEVYNAGSTVLSLAGIRFDDNSFTFANSVPLLGVTSLSPGERAVFIESADNVGAEAASFKTFWGGPAATGQVGFYNGAMAGVSLSATADGVELFDASGTVLTQVSFGAATTGSSFFGLSAPGATNTTFTSVSVVGQNGAYASAGTVTAGTNNVGSPTVPEPGTYALLAAGAVLGGCALRRRRARA